MLIRMADNIRFTLNGEPVEVIGLYVPPENIFAPPGTEVGAIVPYLLLVLMLIVRPRGLLGTRDV